MEVDHASTIENRPGRSNTTILHATQPTEEGVARAVLDLLADQADRGWRVAVAGPPRRDFVADVELRDGEHHSWPARRSPGPGSTVETLRLARIVRQVDPDLVHLHSSKAGLAGRLAVRGRRPTVFQPHAWSFQAVDGLQRRGALLWERLAVRWTDAIVCVSDGERLSGEAAGIDGPFRVIPNGVDLAAFTPASNEERTAARARLRLPDAPLVVCIGRLSQQKGQDVLLAAWATVRDLVPDARLALVGDGPDRDRLESSAPSSVVFAGTRSDVPDWIAAADVVTAPSRWEGMSIAMLEALARARSVVAADTAGAAEALGGEAGAIVPIEDAQALADALAQRLLNPGLAEAEGLRGRARAERHYDLRRVTAGIADLYGNLLARPS